MGSVDRIIGTLGVAFSFLCTGLTVVLVGWTLAAPDTSSDGWGDIRVIALYPLTLIGVCAAALSTDGGRERTRLGFGAFAVSLLAVFILYVAH